MGLRKLVYYPAFGTALTFDGKPFFLLKIDGLANPGADNFEQKAPDQDGSTYIDTLLQNRNIACEVAIDTPNAFDEIDQYRRVLNKKLNPKNGYGRLVYTTEAGYEYEIEAIPAASPLFANKDYRDPWPRCLIVFLCNDPYWKKLTSNSLTLPVAKTGTELAIINTASKNFFYPESVYAPNGDLLVFSWNSTDSTVEYVRSTDNGATFGAPVVAVAASGLYPKAIVTNAGLLMLAYKNTSNYLVHRTSADNGATWSAETTITTIDATFFDIVQLIGGDYIIIYKRVSDGLLYGRKSVDATTWGTAYALAAISTASDFPALVEKLDGSLFMVYSKTSDHILYTTTSADAGLTWSTPIAVTSYAVTKLSLFIKSNQSFVLYFGLYSTNYIYKIESADGVTWQAASQISSAGSLGSPDAVELPTGGAFIAYTVTAAFTTIKRLLRTYSALPATVTGDVETPVLITIDGPSYNPRVINESTGEYIRFNLNVEAGDSLEIDTSFSNKKITYTKDGILKNGSAYLDIGSTLFGLAPSTIPDNALTSVDVWNGMDAWWSMDQTLTEYPDGTPTYFQNAWLTVDSWASNPTFGSATVSVAGGKLIATATINTNLFGAIRTVSAASGSFIRIKLNSSKNQTIRIGGTVGGVPVTTIKDFTVVAGVENVLDCVVTGTLTALFFFAFSANALIGDTLSADFIYIGDGTYSTLLSDDSGNGNTLSLVASLPVAGTSGNAIFRNGINAYEKTTAAQTMPDIFWYHEIWTIPNHATQIQVLVGVGGTGIPRLLIDREINTRKLRISYWNGSATITLTITDFFPSDTSQVVADIEINWLTGVIFVSKDGVLFSTLTMTSALKPATTEWYFGSQAALTSTQFANGTVDERRIYPRALSADEVLYLYNNPGVDFPADANSIYFEDDAVASTATATMEWTERYIGI